MNQTFSPSPRTTRLDPVDMDRVTSLLEQSRSLFGNLDAHAYMFNKHERAEKLWRIAKVGFAILSVGCAAAFVANPAPDYRWLFTLGLAGSAVLAMKSRSYEKQNYALMVLHASAATTAHKGCLSIAKHLHAMAYPPEYDVNNFTSPDSNPPDDQPICSEIQVDAAACRIAYGLKNLKQTKPSGVA